MLNMYTYTTYDKDRVRRVAVTRVLLFAAAKATLTGESAVYVKAGSTISLTCHINLFSVPPPDIVWYRGRRVSSTDYRIEDN